jgi:hypothetical protein
MLLHLADRRDYQVIKGVKELQLRYIEKGPFYGILE